MPLNTSMNHIDERTLELYVLKDPEILVQRDTIEPHLLECAGCRELKERMEHLYAGFFDRVENLQQPTDNAALPVRSSRKSLVPRAETPLQEVHATYEVDRSPVRSIIRFAKHYPGVTASGSMFLVAFAVLLTMQISRMMERRDGNPTYYLYNVPQGRLEVFNKQNEVIWSLPVNGLDKEMTGGGMVLHHSTEVIDIDGDGENELLTVLSVGGQTAVKSSLRLFNHKGELRRAFTFVDKDIQFRGIKYQTEFHPGTFLTLRAKNGKLNILVSAGNGRSPSFIARLDSNFTVLGKYWHYGGGGGPYAIDLNNNGRKEIAFTGVNDVDDIHGQKFPVLTILDPEKISGDQEATTTRGFGFKSSPAEIFYVRFPETDVEATLKLRAIARKVEVEDSTAFFVTVSTTPNNEDEKYFGVDYIFSKRDMSVREVKFITGSERTHERLKEAGKIHSTFDAGYLEDLKNRVEYLDGNKWKREPGQLNSVALSLK